MEKLCQAFENGKELVELSQASPHDISNVLKLYLRQVSQTGGGVVGLGAWPDAAVVWGLVWLGVPKSGRGKNWGCGQSAVGGASIWAWPQKAHTT